MICNVAYIRQHFRVELSVTDNAINDAITATESALSQMVGITNYTLLDGWAALTPAPPAIDGGMLTDGGTPPQNVLMFSGFRNLIGCGVVSMLLQTQDIVVTSFGTVRKKDEYSEHANAFDTGKMFELFFRNGTAQYCEVMGWRYNAPNLSTAYTTKFFDGMAKGGRR